MANENRQRLDPVDAVQDILSELKGRAQEAEKANDAYVFGIYNRLVKLVSPIATQAFARQQREERARIAKTDKRMRKDARKERDAEKAKPEDDKSSGDNQ
jgi:hypothetical protein